MGFQISQVINKFLPTKITSSDVAVPTDLQYHDLQDTNPLPTKNLSNLTIKNLFLNEEIEAGGRKTADFIVPSGNTLDISIRLTTSANFTVFFLPHMGTIDYQAGPNITAIETESGNSGVTSQALRIVAPRYRIQVRNNGTSPLTVSELSVVEHSGGV